MHLALEHSCYLEALPLPDLPPTSSPTPAHTPEDQISRFLGGLWHLNRRLKADILPLLEPLGLDLRLYFILSSIHKGAQHPSVIAQRLELPASLLSRYLDTLRKLGYTERSTDPHDSRRVLLSLTPAGEAAVLAALTQIKRRTGERLEGLDPARLSNLLDAIDLLASLEPHNLPVTLPVTEHTDATKHVQSVPVKTKLSTKK